MINLKSYVVSTGFDTSHTMLYCVYTNIPSCRRDESKTSFPLQEGIFVYARVFVQLNSCIMAIKQAPFNLFIRYSSQ